MTEGEPMAFHSAELRILAAKLEQVLLVRNLWIGGLVVAGLGALIAV